MLYIWILIYLTNTNMEDFYDRFGDCYDDSFIEEHRDQEIIETAFDGDAKAYYIWKVSN